MAVEKKGDTKMKTAFMHETAQMHAELCAAFTDPTRILILYALNEHPCYVGELAQELNLAHSTASRHLKVLRERGLVVALRQGTVVQYQLADPRLIQALDILRGVLRDFTANRDRLIEDVDS